MRGPLCTITCDQWPQGTYRDIFSRVTTTQTVLVPPTKWRMSWARPSMNSIQPSLTPRQHPIWPRWWAVMAALTVPCLGQWVQRSKWVVLQEVTARIVTSEQYLNRQTSWMYYKRRRWLLRPGLTYYRHSMGWRASQWKCSRQTSLSRLYRVKPVESLRVNHLLTRSWWVLPHLTRTLSKFQPSTPPLQVYLLASCQ